MLILYGNGITFHFLTCDIFRKKERKKKYTDWRDVCLLKR